MLIDGISLVSNSAIANSRIESGNTLPANPNVGSMYYLSVGSGGRAPGLYVYNGTEWATGDISSVEAGSGLTGGGASGDISLAIDTTIVATKDFVQSSPVDGGNF